MRCQLRFFDLEERYAQLSKAINWLKQLVLSLSVTA